MSLETATRALLLADTAIAALVGARLRPLNLAQNDVRPALVYELQDEALMTFTGAARYSRASYELTIIADTYAGCAALSDETRRVLSGYAGNTDGTHRIGPSILEDEDDVEPVNLPGQERPVYTRTQTYRILHRAIP